jgi:beta-phosphoglucomutase family hydrolase
MIDEPVGRRNMIIRTTPVLAEGLALIFDMDGVLLNSNTAHREAWTAYNHSFGLETTEEMIQRMYGRRNDQIVRDFFGDSLSDDEVARRGADKERLYRELVAPRLEQMLVPGIREFLEQYRGAPLGVASNAEPENVSFLLDRAGLRQFFRVVVDGHQVSRPKPHPEIYLRAAEWLKVAPKNALVFEDSHSGVEAARAAGMRVIGMRTTYVDLPGTSISVDNYLSTELYMWLATQRRAV